MLSNGISDAIWFSTDVVASLKVGQNVSVWTKAKEQSYPEQARADKIEINDEKWGSRSTIRYSTIGRFPGNMESAF